MSHRYPQEVALQDGRRLLLRPFESSDVDALHAFFLRLPEKERRAAWDRIDDKSIVEEWGRSLDYSKTFALLALDDGKIVADATLHFRRHGPLRHVGRIRWMIDPAYRHRGLGTTFVKQFMEIGRADGLRRLNCMLAGALEKEAVEVLEKLGFEKIQIPGYGTDPDGAPQDMTMLIYKL